ncbi:MAG: glycosyltransferase [Caldilinea sp.]|nr:glycosyltransferase [Caldilinea sp.]MDW8438867.1 glycosyltransferase [Caldilineaceae bacterium]
MRILFITPQAPYPPRQGATMRNYYFIRGLAHNHAVDLLTFLAPGDRIADDSPLKTLCGRIAAVDQPVRTALQRVRSTLTTLTPDMGLRLESEAMYRLVRRWLAETHYDVVQIEGIELAQYARPLLERGRAATRPALVFDDHNCEYLLQKRNALTDLRHPRRWPAAVYSLVQWQKLRRYEASIVRSADAVIAVSEADRLALLDLGAPTPIVVAPNGIDLDAYRPSQTVSPLRTIVFTGKMDYRPNIDAVLWFAQNVLPRVLAKAPDARFQIVGMNPHPRLDALRRHPAIEITGAVADTRPYIHRAGAYVIPMRVGGGTRFKVLEALACAAPVVSTTLGVEGVEVRHGQELLLADEPEAFADAVLRLLEDAQQGGALRRQLGAQGRRFVEQRYGWEQILPKLEKTLVLAQRNKKSV